MKNNKIYMINISLLRMLYTIGIKKNCVKSNNIFPVIYPAPAVEGAAPPKDQGNRKAMSAIYATAAVPVFDQVFFCSS